MTFSRSSLLLRLALSVAWARIRTPARGTPNLLDDVTSPRAVADSVLALLELPRQIEAFSELLRAVQPGER